MQEDEAGMPGLNFTAMLEHAQAAARNGLSSGEEETAATPGQRQVGSKARASDWAADRPPDVRTSSLVATGCPSNWLPLLGGTRVVFPRPESSWFWES